MPHFSHRHLRTVHEIDLESYKASQSSTLDSHKDPGPFKCVPSAAIPEILASGEHDWVGDKIWLRDAKGGYYRSTRAKGFEFSNGLKLSYGDINALAGDYYGTYDPICLGKEAEQQSLFQRAWETLAGNDGNVQPKEANDILAYMQKETDLLKKAVASGIQPSYAYYKLDSPLDDLRKYEEITSGSGRQFPTYVWLLLNNLDHFGADARTAYEAGHACALKVAADGKGDAAKLKDAYAMNAFADHFLEDSFAAGHVRTPRRMLHGEYAKKPDPGLLQAIENVLEEGYEAVMQVKKDYLASLMHDEDNAIGLQVVNKRGDHWTMYGDEHLLDSDDSNNYCHLLNAVQRSADEIYYAWTTGGPPKEYGALNYAPILEYALDSSKQDLVALCVDKRSVDGESEGQLFRNSIKGRRRNSENLKYTWLWSYLTAVAEIKWSGYWDYKMTLDGHTPPPQSGRTSLEGAR